MGKKLIKQRKFVGEKKRTDTMFFKAKSKKYADIVSLETPRKATDSANTLTREYNQAETRDKKRRIIRVVNLAANRAKAMMRKKNLSHKERREFGEIVNIYRKTALHLSRKFEIEYK